MNLHIFDCPIIKQINYIYRIHRDHIIHPYAQIYKEYKYDWLSYDILVDNTYFNCSFITYIWNSVSDCSNIVALLENKKYIICPDKKYLIKTI